MTNYTESKKRLDAIRNNYSCVEDMIFRAAVQMTVEYGQHTLLNDDWYNAEIAKLDVNKSWYHVEKTIYECARQIATVDSMNFLVYIQKEVWLGDDGGIGYQRAMKIIKSCLDWFTDDSDNQQVINNLNALGITDNELEQLGYGWLFEEEDAGWVL